MVNDENLKAEKSELKQINAQNDLSSALGGLDRTLVVTYEAIMKKMADIEDKVVELDSKFQKLSADTEKAIKEASQPEKDSKEDKNDRLE